MDKLFNLSAIKVYNNLKFSAICEHQNFADSFDLFSPIQSSSKQANTPQATQQTA